MRSLERERVREVVQLFPRCPSGTGALRWISFLVLAGCIEPGEHLKVQELRLSPCPRCGAASIDRGRVSKAALVGKLSSGSGLFQQRAVRSY